MPTVNKPAPQRLTGGPVTRFRGPDEIIIREIHPSGQITKILADTVGKALRRDTLVLCGLFHFLAVFVCPRQEHDVIAVQSLESRQHIAGKCCVGVPDMRFVIHVIDRRRDIKRCLGLACHSAVHDIVKAQGCRGKSLWQDVTTTPRQGKDFWCNFVSSRSRKWAKSKYNPSAFWADSRNSACAVASLSAE
ncbi:MAG: Uncharacterised protein [SAR116 cluster bacterium]|nr:MAG: Uncharacterised protein [SAR116 cluster bacterium]